MRRVSMPVKWLTLFSIFLLPLLLAACERPFRQVEETPEVTPGVPDLGQTPEAVPPTPDLGDGVEQPPATNGAAPTPETGDGAVETPPAGEATLEPPADGAEDGADDGAEPETGDGTAEEPAGDGTYTVQPGDTLFSIAQRFGTTVDELAAANGITNPDAIDVGLVLVIPGASDDGAGETGDDGADEEVTGEQVYIIRPGDTLGTIAQQFGRTAEELAAYNNIDVDTTIYAGDELLIPPSDWELPDQEGDGDA